MDEKARSLLLVTHYFPAHGGGIELVAGNISQRLGTQGWRIEWFASAIDEPPTYPGVAARPQATFNGIERAFGLPLPIWSPAAFARLVRAVRAHNVVHIHDCLYPANFLAALAALGLRKRLVVTQHVGFVPYRNPLLRGLLGIANRIAARLVLRRADAVLFVSPVVRAYFEDLVGRTPSFADRSNGVDTVLFSPVPEDRRVALRTSLGLPGDRPILLFVGRHVEKKGLDLVRKIASVTPQWTWCLIGDGPVRPASWGLPNVSALGHKQQAEIVDYYRAADVLVLPSVGEGFPLVVQEALSAGLPVAVHTESRDAGDLPGTVGIVESVLGDDAVERWKQSLATLLDESPEGRAKQREACRTFAADRWSWETTVKAYAEALAPA